MDLSKNEQVRTFLSHLDLTEPDRFWSVMEIRRIVFDRFPDVQEKIMYGGIVFFLDDNMFSGVFVSKKHISLEFSRGYLMSDPNKHLEGSGKYRRHLKIKAHSDITDKEVAFFVGQSVD